MIITDKINQIKLIKYEVQGFVILIGIGMRRTNKTVFFCFCLLPTEFLQEFFYLVKVKKKRCRCTNKEIGKQSLNSGRDSLCLLCTNALENVPSAVFYHIFCLK